MRIIIKLKSNKKIIGYAVLILFGFLASGFFLKMQFTSQAPEGNWGEPWYNDCEEVSIAMVDSFYNNRILTPQVAKKEILRIISLKEKAYGFSLDENADKMVDLINNFLNWKARVKENPTIEQIKNEIDNNHPVILPTDGRKLDNRYYTTTEFHVIVITGYDDEKKMFIVEDAGTYHGHNYQYSYDVVENAMHDYDPADLAKGRRVAIFTSPEIKKADEPEVMASLVPIPTGSNLGNREINNNSPIVLEKSVGSASAMNTIKNYLANFIEWLKKTIRNL